MELVFEFDRMLDRQVLSTTREIYLRSGLAYQSKRDPPMPSNSGPCRPRQLQKLTEIYKIRKTKGKKRLRMQRKNGVSDYYMLLGSIVHNSLTLSLIVSHFWMLFYVTSASLCLPSTKPPFSSPPDHKKLSSDPKMLGRMQND